MSRAAQQQAQQTYNQANQLETAALGNSTALYNQLVPTFTQEATNPQGYGKSDIAAMDTAAQQSAGGATGAAVGTAGTLAASNRNMGSFAPTLDQSARDASKTLGNETLGVQNANEELKQRQQQAGLAGLSGLQGEQNSDVLGSLGLENQSTNALVNAGNSGWFQNMVSLISALKPGGNVSFPQSQGGDDDDEESELEDAASMAGGAP